MKKNKLYRVGAALMAALMVVTCIPQTSLYALAEEPKIADEEMALVEMQSDDTLQEETVGAAEDDDESQEQTVQPLDDDDPQEEQPTPTPEPKPVTGIKLNKNTLTLMKNKSEQLVCTYEPSDANVGKEVEFTSSDSAAVEVNKSGLVIAKAVPKDGSPVIITATAVVDKNIIATCAVTVEPIPVESVTIYPKTLELTVGDQKNGTLTVEVLPNDADVSDLRVESTNPKVATVKSQYNKDTKKYDITVTPVSGGVTHIRAIIPDENKKLSDECTVIVNNKPVALTSLGLKSSRTSIEDGETLDFTVVYDPEYTTQTGVDCKVTKVIDYKDDDTEVKNGGTENEDAINSLSVSVDEDGNGTLRCLSSLPADVKKREVTITVTSTEKEDGNGKYVSADLTVTITKKNVPARSLVVLTKELVLAEGGRNQTGIVEVKLDPLDSTDRTITATVDKGNIAKIDESAEIDGKGIASFKVTGMSPGNCEITFKAGTVKATLPVTVETYVAPVDSLELSSASLSVTEPNTEPNTELNSVVLTAEIKPLEAENKYIDWSVSDPEIATIKDLGAEGRTIAAKKMEAGNEKLTSTITINALMVGECVVTATAAGGISRTCKITVEPDKDKAVTGFTIKTSVVGIGENPEEIYIKQGQSITFTPNVSPSGANSKVRWSSSSDVASVSVGKDSVCTVTADHTGECTVTAQASSSDPGCTKTITFHVMKPRLKVDSPEDFSFTPDMQPITEAMLKEKLAVSFYPYEVAAVTEKAVTLSADQYRLEIVAENGKSVRPYAPEDMEKAGAKMLVISYDYNDGQRYVYPERILVTMMEFSEAVLLSVDPLSEEASEIWNVPNGTPVSSLPLVKTTEITVKGVKSGKTVKADADIQWKLDAIDYDANFAEAQEFVVYGTIKLPEYVKNNDNISLDVSAKVHVREAASSGKRAEAPRFSILGGAAIANKTAVEVPYGSKIVIESDTEGAEIYFMLDRRPDEERGIPHDEEHRYRSPLEMTAKTTTIYAIAAKSEYSDSNCSECTIKLIQADFDEPVDPDDTEPDQVTDTDRPTTGKVPNGLWVAIQPDEEGRRDDFLYTGSAIKPVIHVYDHTTLLTEKKDYKIAYKNNIKAGEKGAANSPSIIITGRGNYNGTTEVSFTIKPQSIEDNSVVMEDYVAVAYNKKQQNPNPVLFWKGKKLLKGRDFTFANGTFIEPKKYEITVTGIGNFTGTRKLTYEIFTGGVSVSSLKITKIPDQKCTGAAITPSVVVKYKNTVLRENANYTVQYKNNIEVGTATAIITGLGNYKGTRRVDFKIKAMAKIRDAGFTMVFDPVAPVYNGVPVKPVSYKAVYQGEELKEGVDYKVSYENNDKAGTASLILTGMGRFTGTARKKYKIQAGELGKGMIVEMETSFPYEKGGCKPKPRIISGNYILQEGKDYSLSYSGNKKVGNNASVTIIGKDSFKGSIVKQFSVTMQDIGNLEVVAADQPYRNKRDSYRTRVKVIDLNGKALTAGVDYDRQVYYTYADGPKQGEQVPSTDLVPKGTCLRVEVKVTNPKNYNGKAYGLYRIVQADISNAKVKVDPQDYTGRMKKPGKDQIHVTLNDVLLGDSDYEIVKYENNVNQGTAKVTIRGIGNYGGTKTVNFKIRKRGVINLTF